MLAFIAIRSSWLIKHTAAFAAALAAATAFAADFPVKAVRIVTPFPPGGSVDLVARMLGADLGKVNLFAVHYKGGGFATTATISGENQVFFSNTISDVLPQVEARRLRALGVTGLKRSLVAPQIPTLAESGLPGYEFSTWHIFAAPAATPRAVINQISDRLRASLGTPEAVRRWRERSVEIIASTPDEAAAHLKKEVQKWRVVFKERGMRAE